MTTTVTPTVGPLTSLNEEEALFRRNIRNFAEVTIEPIVARMDEDAQYDPDLLPRLFELGLMGIEIPERYGGSGSSFFMACLAIEELSRVDASVGVLVDVQNTLVNNALLRWGTPEQHATFLPKMARHTIGSYAPHSGSRWPPCIPGRLRPERFPWAPGTHPARVHTYCLPEYRVSFPPCRR